MDKQKSILGRWYLFDPDRADCYFALLGVYESVYLEAPSREDRDWLVAGFRQLLFGADGRSRARGHAQGRAARGSVARAQGADNGGGGRAAAAAATGSPSATSSSSTGAGSNPNAVYVFNLFDKDGNGYLDTREAGEALLWAGFASSRSEVQQLLQRFDANSDGRLDLDEFSELMVACEHGGSMLDAFRAFDASGDGYIDEFELGQMLGRMGQDVSESQVATILRQIDVNGDGKVDYGEFKRMMNQQQQSRPPGS